MLSLKKQELKKQYIKQNLNRNREIYFLKKSNKINLNKRWLKKLRYYKQFGNLKRFFLKKDRSMYRNYSFRRNLALNRANKSFYQSLSENSLEIILIRSHWAISIDQAKHFIKNKYIDFNHKNIQPGDIISAHPSILPIIFNNILLHKKSGSKIPSYIKRSSNKIYILKNPSDFLLPHNFYN